MTVLFTCAGRRNYLIRYFKQIIGDDGKTIAIDSDATAPALAEADMAMIVPPLNDVDYLKTLLSIIKDNQVDLVVPLNDIELPMMAANKEKLKAYGANVIVSHPNLIDLCADKWKTYNFFEGLKITTPRSFIRIDDVLVGLADKSIDFPIILKPRWGFGSLGIQEVETEEELRLAHQLIMLRADRTLMSGIAGATFENHIIFQEKITGDEYGMDIVNDFHGNFYGSYARRKLNMRAGETDKAISVVDRRFFEAAEKIGNATQHIGIMDCDFFLKDGEICFLEMNPRFGGGYPFSHTAGVNVPAMYMAWLNGETDISKHENYEHGRIFSKCERIIEVREPRTAP